LLEKHNLPDPNATGPALLALYVCRMIERCMNLGCKGVGHAMRLIEQAKRAA
jgi:hypothetical protein